MNIKVNFDNIKVKETKKDFTVKILMLKGEKGEQGDLNPSHIVDNLTSNDSSKVLSAKQGKVLKDLVDKKPYYYNTVADMKAGNLSVGDYVITKGYYSANDGGHGEYIIVNDNELIEDNALIHNLNNNLKARLIINENVINPCQFGAKHTEGQDDSSILQLCLDILHQHEIKCLDLQDYTYYISNPLHLDSNYNCYIQNGQIHANSNFNIDDDETKNYLLYLTNVKNTEPSGYYGYATNDLSMINLTFDCKLISGLGCLNLKSLLRMTINNCVFHRYTTEGIMFNDQWSHELILTNSTFVASFQNEINTTAVGIKGIKIFDCIFSNLVIVGGKYGIELDECKADTFSKIHTYGLEQYGIYLNKSVQLLFDEMYIDGKGVYILNPWLTTFVNCYFLNNVTPITLDKENNNINIYGLKFIGCIGDNYGDSSIDLLYFPNGKFNRVTQSEFDITISSNIYNNKYLGVGFGESENNVLFLHSETPTLLLNESGVITNASSMSGRYTGTVINNIVNITNYDSSGYTWAGFVIPLSQNTNYKTINLHLHNQNYKIYGFSDLNANTQGTVLKDNNVNDRTYNIFNSGAYNYYVLAFYGTQIVEPEISTL